MEISIIDHVWRDQWVVVLLEVPLLAAGAAAPQWESCLVCWHQTVWPIPQQTDGISLTPYIFTCLLQSSNVGCKLLFKWPKPNLQTYVYKEVKHTYKVAFSRHNICITKDSILLC